VDELYWTVGPLLLGSDTLPMVAVPPGSPETPVRASLAAVLRHDDELMLRYRLHPGGTETT
jgi:riboflavin biosynthesis pyrimidine reductase